MKTILAIAILGLAACGGSDNETTTPTQPPVNSGTPLADVTGNYTINQFAVFLDNQPHPETLMATGPMTLTQIGSNVTGLAVLRDATRPNDPTAYTEVRAMSGTVAVENGISVVRLHDQLSTDMVAAVDASRNLTAFPGEAHAFCTRVPLTFPCDAIKSK